jgi:hypothetical protein
MARQDGIDFLCSSVNLAQMLSRSRLILSRNERREMAF